MPPRGEGGGGCWVCDSSAPPKVLRCPKRYFFSSNGVSLPSVPPPLLAMGGSLGRQHPKQSWDVTGCYRAVGDTGGHPPGERSWGTLSGLQPPPPQVTRVCIWPPPFLL